MVQQMQLAMAEAERLEREEAQQLAQQQAEAERLEREEAEVAARLAEDRRLAEEAQRAGQFSCPICLDDEVPMEDVFHLDACEHKVCRNCAHRLVSAKLADRQLPLTCPIVDPLCGSVIAEWNAMTVMNEAQQQTWTWTRPPSA